MGYCRGEKKSLVGDFDPGSVCIDRLVLGNFIPAIYFLRSESQSWFVFKVHELGQSKAYAGYFRPRSWWHSSSRWCIMGERGRHWVPYQWIPRYNLMGYLAFVIERTFDHRFSIATEHGSICKIRSGNISFRKSLLTRLWSVEGGYFLSGRGRPVEPHSSRSHPPVSIWSRDEKTRILYADSCLLLVREMPQFLLLELTKDSALLILEHPLPSSSKSNEVPVPPQIGDYPTIEPDVIARESARTSQNFMPGGSIPLAQVSPFILHLLYQACIILSSSSGEARAEDAISLVHLQEALKALNQRWLASGRRSPSIDSVSSLGNMAVEAYLNLLAARKAMSEI